MYNHTGIISHSRNQYQSESNNNKINNNNNKTLLDEEILAYIDRSLEKFKESGYYKRPNSERYGSFNDLNQNDFYDQQHRQQQQMLHRNNHHIDSNTNHSQYERVNITHNEIFNIIFFLTLHYVILILFFIAIQLNNKY